MNWLQMRTSERENPLAQSAQQKNNNRRGEVRGSSLLLSFLGSESGIGGQQALAYCRLLTDRPTAEQCSVECQTFVS